jgi:hypothetical protein
MSASRFASFSEFFPYYLGEHRNSTCRALHFFGTAGFFTAVVISLIREPLWFGAALAIGVVLGVIGNMVERRRNAAPLLLGMVVVAAVAHPWVLLGVVWAYGFAWVGHFKIEHNRPATFVYPLWSLLGDFRMWGMMATGRLWRGDPLAELGLSVRMPDQASV